MTVVVGLGLLSFLDIVFSLVGLGFPIITSFLGGKGKDKDKEPEGEDKSDEARRYQRNLRFLTDNVLNAIESFSDKNK